jgi:hypothetical protein
LFLFFFLLILTNDVVSRWILTNAWSTDENYGGSSLKISLKSEVLMFLTLKISVFLDIARHCRDDKSSAWLNFVSVSHLLLAQLKVVCINCITVVFLLLPLSFVCYHSLLPILCDADVIWDVVISVCAHVRGGGAVNFVEDNI